MQGDLDLICRARDGCDGGVGAAPGRRWSERVERLPVGRRVEGRVGKHAVVLGVLPLDEQSPLVGIPWVQARVVLLADAGTEVGHGEHAAVQGVLRIGQATAGVQAVEELPDRRGSAPSS
jgi:hypothetical protein